MAHRRKNVDTIEYSQNNYPMDKMDTNENPNYQRNYRNRLYSDAYGEYSGGYGCRRNPLGFGPGPGPEHWHRSQPPPLMIGSGFGPAGPPSKKIIHDDRPIKYLMRCGIAKEDLINLPKELLQLIEPQHCGICSLSFDSFSFSRLHYTSKNHMKSQKRWLMQEPHMATYSQKETPLRARELFCELCNIDITSKMHADSHYAGKAHRAIVYGRKNPKNSVLLQKHMEDRLDRLIRREKRNMKTVSETTSEKVQKDSGTKKPIQGELYCDICKTSVTCTEQMTMHLNGKKHLSKEKQYIMKMMNGEMPNNSVNNEDGTAADGCEDTEETANTDTDDRIIRNFDDDNDGEGEDKNDKYDWGNGSSAWDDNEDQKNS